MVNRIKHEVLHVNQEPRPLRERSTGTNGLHIIGSNSFSSVVLSLLQRASTFLAVTLIWQASICPAIGASTDRNTLYAITPTGTVLQINTSTGAGTVVRTLSPNNSYGNLFVYKGAFVTVSSTGVIAFGLTAYDEVRLPLINTTSAEYDESSVWKSNLTEYPSTGFARGWVTQFPPPYTTQYMYQREFDPISGADSPVDSTGVVPLTTISPYWTCYPVSGVPGSTFFGNNRAYALQSCLRNDGYSEGARALVRVDYSSGTWGITLDAIAPISNTTNALAADPANDGVVYAGAYDSAIVQKLVISGSSMSETDLGTISGITGIAGLAFGPPTSDVLSPGSVTDLQPFTPGAHPWTPIAMTLGLN